MIEIKKITKSQAVIAWKGRPGVKAWRIYWSDRETKTENYKLLEEIPGETICQYTLHKSTHMPHYVRVCPVTEQGEEKGEELITPVHYQKEEQRESLSRGLIAVKTKTGIFLSWRLFLSEVTGYDKEGESLQGVDFTVYRNGEKIGFVTDRTSFLDQEGKESFRYQVAAVLNGQEQKPCPAVSVWEREYLEIPLKKPEGGVTPSGEEFTYSANDMSVADVDGDGEYEYLVKWDPSNSHDVSIKGYTGRCLIDCYRISGELLWRLDLGPNIRAGAHYTQFMCYDFNGDGKAEMALKTAPGTRMTLYEPDGREKEAFYITMPEEDVQKGFCNEDSYVYSGADYREHLIRLFASWREQEEVKNGHWPDTLEQCFGIENQCSYPLSRENAEKLVDYFLDVYAPLRSPKNDLRKFEGFICQGPEYLTMFGGDGKELETIPFPFPRVDDGLLWGDYAMERIEPCNRVDRFLSGVAYLDGRRPYLVVCRGYYTRTAVAAYDFFENRFHQVWSVDSGFVPMKNPFKDSPHDLNGTDPIFGELVGQGNHSLSVADVDGDGCMEIIYGAACIDHDGSLLYSSKDKLPGGRLAKLGHGDAMHVADIDPDRPGFEIFNVFEGAEHAPYGYALREAETGKVLFGEYAEEDLGRCMVGDVLPEVRGLQCWVNGVGTYDCHGNLLKKETLGTNMSIRWSGDLTTQILDGEDYLNQKPIGEINDFIHGVMLRPEGTKTNNETKGNPCLVADVFGDFREELLLRTKDSSAIRIYTNIELSHHKLFTLMHDIQYRCGVAWQNNCYNQPCYPSFYYGSDMEFDQVLPYMKKRPVIFLAGDSICQTYKGEGRIKYGWGEFLLEHLVKGEAYQRKRRKNCPFEQEMRYESRGLIADNCAAAGRSSKTFLEEGRLEDIKEQMKEGDYLLIQFGHNDANEAKPERFAVPEEFPNYLKKYLEAAREKKAVPVLISPVCLCPCEENQKGEGARIAKALPEYCGRMEELAKREGVLYVDLYRLTAGYCKELSKEEAKSLYVPDRVHLSRTGADCFGGFLADELRKFIIEGKSEV